MKKLKKYKYEHYAILCQLAYPSEGIYDHHLSDYEQIEILDRFKKPCVRVVWQPDKKEAIVVFRGSYNIYDWALNLCCWQSTTSHHGVTFSVHWGLKQLLRQNAYLNENTQPQPLQLLVEQQLNVLLSLGKRITLIGHSTGGSMAVLLADRFSRKHPKSVKRVVTFGQPAVGGKRFQRAYINNNKTYRICCDLDFVTFLPPLPFYYRHVGKLLWLHDEVIYENITPVARFFTSMKSWLLRPITYHYMRKYIRNKELFDEH